MTSIIRSPSHADDITAASATPLVLSLEDASVSDFTNVFEDTDVVVWSAGAGGKGGPERTKAVDYEGALKVFDAIEAVQGKKPRLILVSAVDVRDRTKIPAHYASRACYIIINLQYLADDVPPLPFSLQNEKDLEKSASVWKSIGTYMQYKYEADKNLVNRTTFPWTIVRPPTLLDTPGTGKADAGVTHVTEPLSVRPLRNSKFVFLRLAACS